MSHRISRVDVDANAFHIEVDGVRKFRCQREFLEGGRRGHWELVYFSAIGALIMDRDQYSNDIMEKVWIHLNERPLYGSRYKKYCTPEEFNKGVATWVQVLATEFGGTWTAEYDSYSDRAIFEKS